MQDILHHYHTLDHGGYLGGQRTTMKVLRCGIYQTTLFKDVHTYVCQRCGNISKQQEMSSHGILEVELFDVLGIDLMRQFVPSNQNQHIFGSGGLCFQLGGCIRFSNHWYKSGDKVFEQEHFYKVQNTKSNNQ